jgi:hypothetical protein
MVGECHKNFNFINYQGVDINQGHVNQVNVSISKQQLGIFEENILRMLNVPVDQAGDYIIGMIKKYITECLELCSPQGVYACFDTPSFDPNLHQMTINSEPFYLQKMVYSAMKKSSGIIIFIGTCGPAVEKYSKQLLKEGNGLEGFIVDIIGSEIAESVAEIIHKSIESDMAASGLKITNRYSPGYCNWPVSEQQKLFTLMREVDHGVQLTDSSLMLPIKSVSGIIGVGTDVRNMAYACAACDLEQCLYRGRKLS